MIAAATSETELRRANVAVIQRYLDAWSVLDIDAIEARVENGLIRRYAEFSDPLIFMEAFNAND